MQLKRLGMGGFATNRAAEKRARHSLAFCKRKNKLGDPYSLTQNAKIQQQKQKGKLKRPRHSVEFR